MSTFEIKIRQLDDVIPHTNADKLELAVIGGYTSVVKKGRHIKGEYVLYIPEDAKFTDLDIATRLEVASYLVGKNKDRVKAVRLRGELSQGIIVPVAILESTLKCNILRNQVVLDIDWAELLKIEKYEEPIPIQMRGKVRPWPSYISKYDIENIKKPECFNVLIPGELVCITEKLHGTNFSIGFDGTDIHVCSRNMSLEEDDQNVYWRVVKKYDLIEKVKEIKKLHDVISESSCNSVSLHGEVVGVQDLKYGFNNGDVGFFAFDICVDQQFADIESLLFACDLLEIPHVPIIENNFSYDYNNIVSKCVGNSHLSPDTLLEGFVVKPMLERYENKVGRVAFKFINPEYLTRKDGTELH